MNKEQIIIYKPEWKKAGPKPKPAGEKVKTVGFYAKINDIEAVGGIAVARKAAKEAFQKLLNEMNDDNN